MFPFSNIKKWLRNKESELSFHALKKAFKQAGIETRTLPGGLDKKRVEVTNGRLLLENDYFNGKILKGEGKDERSAFQSLAETFHLHSKKGRRLKVDYDGATSLLGMDVDHSIFVEPPEDAVVVGEPIKFPAPPAPHDSGRDLSPVVSIA